MHCAPDGQLSALANDVRGLEREQREPPPLRETVADAVMLPDGKRVVLSSGGFAELSLTIWDLESGELQGPMEGVSGPLALIGRDALLYRRQERFYEISLELFPQLAIWQLEREGTLLFSFDVPQCMHFVPGQPRVVTGCATGRICV